MTPCHASAKAGQSRPDPRPVTRPSVTPRASARGRRVAGVTASRISRLATWRETCTEPIARWTMSRCPVNQAVPTSTAAASRVSRRRRTPETNPAASGISAPAHQRSASRSASHCPANSRTTSAASRADQPASAHGGQPGSLHAPLREPVQDFPLVFRERSLVRGLEPEHEDRLGVGGADEAPAVGERHADAVDVFTG